MKRALFVADRQHTAPVDVPALRRLARTLLVNLLEQTQFDLGIYVVDTTEMTRLNEMFLRHAGPTDVIAFNYGPDPPGHEPLHGEIFLCAAMAIEQARRFRTHWRRELERYLIHGVLHLRGFDDRTPRDRRRMKREEDLLARRLERNSTPSNPKRRLRPAKTTGRTAAPSRR